jgi:hypothetical protein
MDGYAYDRQRTDSARERVYFRSALIKFAIRVHLSAVSAMGSISILNRKYVE